MLPKLSEIAFKRRLLGITQKELALEAGISQSAIAKIERKKMVPNYNTGKRIFETLERLEKWTEKTAKDIMRKRVSGVSPGDSLKKAASIMTKHGFSNLPVVEDGRAIGKISESRIIEAGRENYGMPCLDFMEPPPVTVSENLPSSTIKEILRKEAIVLVVGAGSVVKGIISRSDVI